MHKPTFPLEERPVSFMHLLDRSLAAQRPQSNGFGMIGYPRHVHPKRFVIAEDKSVCVNLKVLGEVPKSIHRIGREPRKVSALSASEHGAHVAVV
jgi:hypothetical protein